MTQRRAKAIFWVFAWGVVSSVRGAEESFLVEMWDVERGLPSGTVTGVAQSPDGYLWLSTVNGLARFDGVRFSTFVGPRLPGLRAGGFNEVAAAGSGEIWARAESGELIVRARSEFTAVKLPETGNAVRSLQTDTAGAAWASLTGGTIARCAEAKLHVVPQSEPYGGLAGAPIRLSDRAVWLVTQSGALLELNQDELVERRPAGAKDQRIIAIDRDASGTVWALGEKDLWQWRDDRWIPIAAPGKGLGDFRGLKIGPEGSVWVWSGDGICRLDQGEWRGARGPWPPVAGGFAPTAQLLDSQGRVWFGTSGHGLVVVNAAGEVTVLSMREGLPSNYILCLARDHEGNVWAGTRRGLVRLKSRQLTVVSWDNPETEPVATGLAEDLAGGLYFGSDGEGLWHCDTGAAASLPQRVAAGPKFCRGLVRDAQGRVWVGTVREGLWVFENGRLASVRGAQLPEREARSLLADSRGRIWIGTTKGLFSWAEGKLTPHAAPPELGVLDVRAMLEDRDGALWVGTRGQGLLRWREGAWEKVSPLPPAPFTVWSLHQDAAGDLWVGTEGWGLARCRAGRVDFFNRTNGLPVDIVYSILEDDEQNLWLGTLEGIVRLKKSECEAAASGQLRRLQPTVLTRSDGLPTLQCAGGFQPNACRTRDGRLWFATNKGVVVADPKHSAPPSGPPSVVLEEVVVQGRAFPVASGMRLGPRPRRLEFHYTALSFSAPERVRFRYRLEGEDKEWIDAGTDRSVMFDTLQPGEHEFAVTACNGDGVWNERGVSLKFIVVPIWWQTWWFRGGVTGGALFLAGVILRQVTTRRLQRRLEAARRQGALERERARIAKDIHDDMGANLTEITMLSELAQSEDAPVAEVREDIRRIATRARELTRSVDATVWAVNPEKDTLDSLVSYVCTFAEDFLETAGIRCRLDMLSQLPGRTVVPEVRHNLFLAVKEALHNVVKHAAASEVRLQISLSDNDFKLVVQDNGRGFSAELVESEITAQYPGPGPRGRRGNGLQNMYRRMQEIGGLCTLTGVPGQGTKIEFEVRLTG